MPPAMATFSRGVGSVRVMKEGVPKRKVRLKASSVRFKERRTSSRSVSGRMGRARSRAAGQQVSWASMSKTLSSSRAFRYFSLIMLIPRKRVRKWILRSPGS